jgi:hypothetical protein
VGVIDQGRYTADGRRLQFNYYQPWNDLEGSVQLTLSADGQVLSGIWQQPGASGTWTLMR